MGVEQLLAVDLHAVRNTDEADVAAGTRGAQGLPHGLWSAGAFQRRVRARLLRSSLAAMTPHSPTAPSPTTATADPGATSAAGWPGVATRVPSEAKNEPITNCPC